MDQKLLTFLTLCDTRHYRQTAELLHITQPAVTQHIKQLEQEYGVPLVRYENRHLLITDAGEQLRRYAREAQYREAELKQQISKTTSPTLRIGATKTIGAYVLGDFLAAYLEDPSHQAEVSVDNTAVLLQLLDENQLDFALIEGFFEKEIYDWQLMRKEPFVGICSATHSFAGRVVSKQELFSETLLLREKGSGTRAILEQVLHSQNDSISSFRRTICLSDFSLITDLVAKSVGISFVYAAVAAHHPALASFTIEGTQIVREFNYVYLKHTNAADKIRQFIMQK